MGSSQLTVPSASGPPWAEQSCPATPFQQAVSTAGKWLLQGPWMILPLKRHHGTRSHKSRQCQSLCVPLTQSRERQMRYGWDGCYHYTADYFTGNPFLSVSEGNTPQSQLEAARRNGWCLSSAKAEGSQVWAQHQLPSDLARPYLKNKNVKSKGLGVGLSVKILSSTLNVAKIKSNNFYNIAQ